MKVSKPNGIAIQQTSTGILHNYVLVPNNYDFAGNTSIDVTSVDNLEVFYSGKIIDFGVFRDSLFVNLIPNWNSMTFDDKKKCVRYYKYPPAISNVEWATYFTDAQHEKNWNATVIESRDFMRLPRLFAAFQKMSYRLTTLQVAMVYMTTKSYCIDYYYANLPHLLLWITNGTYPALGIDFSTNGFAQIDGYTDSLRNEVLDIINNGNY